MNGWEFLDHNIGFILVVFIWAWTIYWLTR